MDLKKLKKERPDLCIHEGHKYVTRRDFLAAGIIPLVASVTLPTVYDLLVKDAIAQSCGGGGGGGGGAGNIPFIHLNFAGGWGTSFCIPPMDQGGNLGSNYGQIGLGLPGAFQANLASMFGVQMFNQSGLFTGFQSYFAGLPGTIADPRPQTALVNVCVDSRDDSGANLMDPSNGLDALAGTAALAGGFDVQNTGLNHQPFFGAGQPTTLNVSNSETLRAATGGTPQNNAFDPNHRDAVLRGVDRLSTSQRNNLFNQAATNYSQVADLVGCSTNENITVGAQPSSIARVQDDADLQAIYNIQNNTGDGDERVRLATMVQGALQGDVKTVKYNRGGYDYHQNDQQRMTNRDNEIAVTIARVLTHLRHRGSGGFVYVTTDGSVRFNATITAPFAPNDQNNGPTSDNGNYSQMLAFFIKPPGQTPTVSRSDGATFNVNQIGDVTFPGGTASPRARTIYPGYGPQTMTLGVIALYLHASLGLTNGRAAFNSMVTSLGMSGIAPSNADLDLYWSRLA